MQPIPNDRQGQVDDKVDSLGAAMFAFSPVWLIAGRLIAQTVH